jgi:hypothetical protein
MKHNCSRILLGISLLVGMSCEPVCSGVTKETFVGDYSCKDYAPFVYPLGCYGVSEEYWLGMQTWDIASLRASLTEGDQISARVWVWDSSCKKTMYRFTGVMFLDTTGLRPVWSGVAFPIETDNTCR